MYKNFITDSHAALMKSEKKSKERKKEADEVNHKKQAKFNETLSLIKEQERKRKNFNNNLDSKFIKSQKIIDEFKRS